MIQTTVIDVLQSDDFGRCCLSERSYNGTKEIDIGAGQTRTWLEDGDEITFNGWVHDADSGKPLFGFGECKGIVQPFPN